MEKMTNHESRGRQKDCIFGDRDYIYYIIGLERFVLETSLWKRGKYSYNPKTGPLRDNPRGLPRYDTIGMRKAAPHSTQWSRRRHTCLHVPFDLIKLIIGTPLISVEGIFSYGRCFNLQYIINIYILYMEVTSPGETLEHTKRAPVVVMQWSGQRSTS